MPQETHPPSQRLAARACALPPRPEGRGFSRLLVTGQFTLMGKTHPVTLKATKFNCYQNPMLKREVCGGDFETSIKRSQWGASYGLNYGFADDMRLVIQVEAVKQ